MASLDLGDADLKDRSIQVRHTKRSKQGTAYLNEEGCRLLKAWIREWEEASGPLFCPIRQTGEARLTRLGGESIAYIQRRRKEQAGVEALSPHDLRRTFATTLLDRGLDLFAVQSLAGHADASTMARYDPSGESPKRMTAKSLETPKTAWGVAERYEL